MRVTGGFKPGSFITRAETLAIAGSAFEILDSIGIRVVSREMSAALGKLGYAEREGRIRIPESETRSFLEELRNDKKLREETESKLRRTEMYGTPGSYATILYNPLNKSYEKLTADLLVKSTKAATLISRRFGGFLSFAPGTPQDVPASLGSLLKFKISAEYGTGPVPVEPTSFISAEFMFRMAEVMNQPVCRLPVYPVSPLCLGGDSAEIVRHFAEKLDSFYVFSMPMLGVTAPLSVKGGMALCFAEVLGCGFLMQKLTGLRCIIRPNIFPADMQTVNYAFGSPRKFLYECLAEDFTAQILGMPVNFHSVNIHTNCSVSGVQSAMEKISLMTAGTMLGATKFYCIGTLSLDEIFSPVELILDALRIGQIKQMAAGFKLEHSAAEDGSNAELLDEIRSSLDGGFIMTDRTLESHGEYVNYSPFINRNLYKTYIANHSTEMLDEAEKTARELFLEDAGPVASPEQRSALREMYRAAELEAAAG
jgi:trimethylamine:corrinoid methyltransferase-like protein